ncbi:D-serine dehydratase [Clostridium punense]|uniref:Probable D-serine dehydratase n=1 Tax=Clostridium punense TaxID=1054297 RepID=A0ABS4K3F0_9CLOT|nr:D-serine ammonia-lyase [Clostridium punense]MBP2022322.1 D-serine dehydratase [Clostridium punense]
MDKEFILGKSKLQWIQEYPVLKDIMDIREVLWINPKRKNFHEAMKNISISELDVKDAEQRLKRFAPFIAKVFPETEITKGIIESALFKINNMKANMESYYDGELLGNLLLKCDSHLPISGSIKARGGIYEVLKHAEDLALKEGILKETDDYSIIDSDIFREFFSKYSVAVGSTGNLGLSIGIISAKLGFKVTVHMSADAKQWKKDLLRSKGVTVVEYKSDYSKAVEEGRKLSEKDSNSYFIDDENSVDLFLGYAVAALRLKNQLEEMKVLVDENHPLFVYLPCGVGGGPGGVAFGLKLIFKDNVHCFFAEPTHSPCMLVGMATEQHNKVSVQDFGIDNLTIADGLAVGRASGFIGKVMEELLSGVYTVEDNELYKLLTTLVDTENIYLEPSALAGMVGISKLFKTVEGRTYMENSNLKNKMNNSTHIVWATGGSMVPKDEMMKYYGIGKDILSQENVQ